MNKNFQKVPFTTGTITKCLCPQCPVQGSSQCAKVKIEKLAEIMKKDAGKTPKSADVPGVYCSNGVAVCKDLDTTQMCICGGCLIFEEYNLAGGKPMFYYCRDGKAS